ncbi:hypothetical protein FB470_000511 [Amycolatopsis thermophila]|uniref:Rubrerythrin-like domain-containing protein n=1 Tax=Amycolatopsis thermophila TaxID=206084 RepID=A0ABU0EMQ4_9PSEU|nr:hypothetical protein [Amycolatopsis thermophila]
MTEPDRREPRPPRLPAVWTYPKAGTYSCTGCGVYIAGLRCPRCEGVRCLVNPE